MHLFARTLRTLASTLLGVSFLGAFAARPATAGIDRWTPFGPGGGTIADLAVDPAAPGTLYAVVEGNYTRNYIFKSLDAGTSWRWAGEGLPGTYSGGPRTLAVDPSQPWVLYTAECASGTAHVFRSTDGAARWSRTTPEAGVGAPTPSPTSSTCRLAVSPGHPDAIYLSVDATLWRSLDHGASWTLVGGTADTIRSLLIDPAAPSTLYVGAARAGGVYRCSLKDATLTRIPGLRQGEALAASRTGRRLYVSSAGILYDSVDHGATWRLRGDLGAPALSLAVDPGDFDVLYAGLDVGASVSRDGGRTWRPAALGLPIVSYPAPAVPVAVLALAAHPFQPGTIFAGTQLAGVYETRDGGDHWRAGDQIGLGGGIYRPPYVHPARPDTIYVQGLDNIGTLWRSTDGGRSWSRRSSAFDRGLFLSTLALDPRSPKTLYASGVLLTGGSGLFKSLDGGATWSGLGLPGASGVAVTGRGTLLATTAAGLWRKVDGASWSLVSGRGGAPSPDPVAPGTVYLTGGGIGEEGVYRMYLERSRDDGLTWQTVMEASPFLAVTPAPGRLYVQIGGRLLRSTDGGDSWSEGIVPSPGTGLAVAPQAPDTLLFAGVGTDIFRSLDGGLTWTRFYRSLSSRGPFYFMQVGAHPAEPRTFFVLPFGAGIFTAHLSGPGE